MVALVLKGSTPRHRDIQCDVTTNLAMGNTESIYVVWARQL